MEGVYQVTWNPQELPVKPFGPVIIPTYWVFNTSKGSLFGWKPGTQGYLLFLVFTSLEFLELLEGRLKGGPSLVIGNF